MRALFALASLTAACASGVQAAPSATSTAPDWMGGYWLSCDDGEVAENWIGAGTGTLVAVNLTQGREAHYEFLRVARDETGAYGYFSMPEGVGPPTEFRMISHEGQRAVFENPTHDFPQRVIYERTGDVLHARIEGTMNGRAGSADWTFQRRPVDTRCP